MRLVLLAFINLLMLSCWPCALQATTSGTAQRIKTLASTTARSARSLSPVALTAAALLSLTVLRAGLNLPPGMPRHFLKPIVDPRAPQQQQQPQPQPQEEHPPAPYPDTLQPRLGGPQVAPPRQYQQNGAPDLSKHCTRAAALPSPVYTYPSPPCRHAAGKGLPLPALRRAP